MGHVLKKKKVKEALKKAKELEAHQPMPREQVVQIYKEGISFGEKLRKFLKPAWFVSDIHSKKKAKKKVKKKSKRIRKSTRKRTVKRKKKK